MTSGGHRKRTNQGKWMWRRWKRMIRRIERQNGKKECNDH